MFRYSIPLRLQPPAAGPASAAEGTVAAGEGAWHRAACSKWPLCYQCQGPYTCNQTLRLRQSSMDTSCLSAWHRSGGLDKSSRMMVVPSLLHFLAPQPRPLTTPPPITGSPRMTAEAIGTALATDVAQIQERLQKSERSLFKFWSLVSVADSCSGFGFLSFSFIARQLLDFLHLISLPFICSCSLSPFSFPSSISLQFPARRQPLHRNLLERGLRPVR